MPNELKPCPFCGGEVNIWFNNEVDNYEIWCKKCNADFQQHYGVRDEAIEAWNRRADNGN